MAGVERQAYGNRSKDEVDQIIRWLTGYSQAGLEQQVERQVDFGWCRHCQPCSRRRFWSGWLAALRFVSDATAVELITSN
ncbi:DUF2200 family protein [Natronocella acetinitrilica]|uniref:DUF2200 family protein n=1 Tax=Natronocella acetinitrilica TaxID=414046 RepID=UPI0020A00725|nr:DUF2200 family protein [Natronocella acetinitrilica]